MRHTAMLALWLAVLPACAHDKVKDHPQQAAQATTAQATHEHAREQHAQSAGGEDRSEHRERAQAARAPRPAEVTPETPGVLDQGNNEIDLDLTQRIRKAVMDDDSLSFAAKNIKIITRDGRVTLRGEVKDRAEKDSISKAAMAAAGAGNVTNQLEIDAD